jgi:molybdopterin/thiamine biosynthesis adenylyltransferase
MNMPEHADSRTLDMIRQLLSKSKINKERWAKESGAVLVVADEKPLRSANGQFALCMAVNALLRLYPILTRIGILIPDALSFVVKVPLFSGNTIHESLVGFADRLRPECEVSMVDRSGGDWDAVLSIGTSKVRLRNKISIASDGWIARVSTNKLSKDFTGKGNPIGAYTAACIGGMEVFKRVFLKKSNVLAPEKAPSDIRWRLRLIKSEVSFSTFDYKVNEKPAYNPPIPAKVDLGNLCIAGVGAGGGAAAYSLASLSNLKGRLILVDPDEVKPSNMNRYVYALRTDFADEWSKVEVIRDLFIHFDKLCVQCYPYPYQRLSESGKIGAMDLLVSTVDTKETRRDIQWDMPRVILDAAVLLSEFYVRRVDIGKSPCLLCTHKADEAKRSSEEIISQVIGLSRKEIVRLRSTNARITREIINRMKEYSAKSGFALPSVGERFSDWELAHCGEFILPSTQERFPLTFSTILPGILIAGEVLKERYFPEGILRNYYSYDMINLPVNGMALQQPLSNCILCSSQKTRDIFATKWKKCA